MLVDLSYLPFTISNDWVSSQRMALYLTGISIRVRVDGLYFYKGRLVLRKPTLYIRILHVWSLREELPCCKEIEAFVRFRNFSR